MASVQFEKFKDCAAIYTKLLHCDRDCRKNKTHRNKDINTAITSKNIQIAGRGYQATCERFRNRIDELDRHANGNNKRAGRVLCFGLDVPAPEHLKDEDANKWFKRVYEIMSSKYGSENILNFYVHKDEKHEYIDAVTHERKMSRFHAHCYVVPVVNDKLNGKAFSSAKNMREINNLIHQMTADEFGVQFMDGSKRSSKKTVEKLKAESAQLEAEANINAIRERERKANELLEEARKTSLRASQSLTEAREQANRIITEASEQANKIITEAREQAKAEIEREKKVRMSSFSNYVRKAVEEKQRRDRAITEIDNPQSDKSEGYTFKK